MIDRSFKNFFWEIWKRKEEHKWQFSKLTESVNGEMQNRWRFECLCSSVTEVTISSTGMTAIRSRLEISGSLVAEMQKYQRWRRQKFEEEKKYFAGTMKFKLPQISIYISALNTVTFLLINLKVQLKI